MDLYSDEAIQAIVDDNHVTAAAQLIPLLGLSCSERTVRREIVRRGIVLYRTHLTSEEVEVVIRESVARLGPVYGRKTTTGYLRSRGINIGERRVGNALTRVAPGPHRHRQMGTSRQINPLTYYAPYFGYNVHMDQNEKLVDFGCVIVAAVDGASCFVIDFVTMPHKNAASIYSDLYLPMITDYGLFDCLVTDHGREFALAQFVQELLSDRRVHEDGSASTRPPYKRLRSTENNRVERIWVMVNDRCTYPVKVVLTDLMERGLIDMTDPFTMFSVSYVVRNVVKVLLQRLKDSWNHHSIPRHGRPVDKVQGSQTFNCTAPATEQAIQRFVESGGQVTDPWSFGDDILMDAERQEIRNNRFRDRLPGHSFEHIADRVIADRNEELLEAIHLFTIVSVEVYNE